MADGIVQLPADSTGKKVDTSELTVGANTVERERVNLADPTTAAAVAGVKNADPASTDYGVEVRPVGVVKGTQGATGVPTQDLKDSGRTSVVLTATGIASVASEALITLQKDVGGTVTAGVTEYVVTAGKTLRVQAITITTRATTPSTTVTFSSDTWKLRQAAATLAITSALVLTATGMCATNVPGAVLDLNIIDGLEFPAATHIGFSHVGTTGMTFDINLIGFEY